MWIDFVGYKEGILWCCIERCMVVCYVFSFDDYLVLVEVDLEELDCLSKDILIFVIVFFCDGEVFIVLCEVLSRLVLIKQFGDEICIWVLVCVIGEEVYSIVMLLVEIFGVKVVYYCIQIFVIDIDMGVFVVVWCGVYNEGVLFDVDLVLVVCYFIKVGEFFEVLCMLCDMVIIVCQDMVIDLFFLCFDLVSCCNVLIYFQNELQVKVLVIFYYGLCFGVYFFFGKLEGIFQQELLFEVVDKGVCLFCW